MILYNILCNINHIKFMFLAWLPSLTTPVWAYEHLPTIFRTIMSFNYYLPVAEVMGLVSSVIVFHLSWKIGKIVVGALSIGAIDLNK